MKICVLGAGAIGGFVGARLTRAGHDVTLIARGAHLEAMRANGLVLLSGTEWIEVRPHCTADPGEPGPQDYVIVTTKAHAVPEVAPAIGPLLGPETPVILAQNGLPWWYFHKTGGPHDGHRLISIDPDGSAWQWIGPERAIGCVVTAACSVVEPGVVRHAAGGKLDLGEPDSGEPHSGETGTSPSPRCRRLVDAFAEAGFETDFKPRIRDEIWAKLWGNVSFSQIAVLTGAGLQTLASDPAIQAFARRIMAEAQAVGEAVGARFPIDIDQRIARTLQMGDHKTSTLQDLEAGRPMEIDAMVGSVIEVGRLAGVPTPTIDMVYALVRRRAKAADCYPANDAFSALIDGA